MFMGITSVVLVAANIGVVDCAMADVAKNRTVNNVVKPVAASEVKDQAILFKIHDVIPVKNNDGEVVGCDYSTTLYNRSDNPISGATLNLKWEDKAISEVIDQEKKEDAKNKQSSGRANSTTERITDKNIDALVDVPAIQPLKQVTVQSRVNSDRCFLLIDDPQFEVKNCTVGSAVARSGNSNMGRSGGCSGLFRYVSAEDPQYYLEFKVISVDQEKEEKEAQQKKEKSETDGLYEKTIKAMEMTDSIISTIK